MVKLVELNHQDREEKIPFNVVDDLAIFMRNDPMFYRKTFFPAMADAGDRMERGESIDPIVILGPVVDKGVNTYCKKFIKNRRPEDIFTDEDRKQAIKKIYAEEMPHIKKGMYKASS
jgi:hypothetical protein